MKRKKENILNNKNINRSNVVKSENFKKNKISIIKKIKFNQKYFFIINFILLENIFILLPKRICYRKYYIEIKVNKEGSNQILSNEYRGTLPSKIYFNILN